MAVSVQQAAANAAVAFLRTKFPGLAVHSRWPGKDFPGKAITLITAGPRRDQAQDPRILSKVNLGDTQTTAIWQIAECTQPFQLDVWATSHTERDDLIAGLDIHLRSGFGPLSTITNKDPVASGFSVALADGWDAIGATTAKFSFTSPNVEDTPESVGNCQFRATYRGTAWMKLAISVVSTRQTQIYLKAYLDGATQPSTNTLID